MSNLPGVVDAPVFLHALAHPRYVSVCAEFTRLAEHGVKTFAFRSRRIRQQVDQHESALSFLNIAAEFLAVAGDIAFKVEQIVLNLKCSSQEEPESHTPIEVYRSSSPD